MNQYMNEQDYPLRMRVRNMLQQRINEGLTSSLAGGSVCYGEKVGMGYKKPLECLTVVQLKARAKRMGHRGYSKLKKAQLIRLIKRGPPKKKTVKRRTRRRK